MNKVSFKIFGAMCKCSSGKYEPFNHFRSVALKHAHVR